MSAALAFNRITIVGVGLIGGSFARALRKHASVGTIVGCSRQREHLERARQLGVVDAITTDPAKAVRDADLVLLATPVGAMQGLFEAIRPALSTDTVVTDAGSTKTSVIAAAKAVFGDMPPRFVPGHPVAGTENSGVEASFDSLFAQRRVILTPTPQTDADALACVRSAWQACGAQVTQMDAAHHDHVLAATSHLPHLLAYSLVDTLAQLNEHTEIFKYAAGGFADFTRIASSSPAMWTDIVQANRDELLAVLDQYTQGVATLRRAIETDDRAAVHACFERAKAARDRFAPGQAGQRGDVQ